MKAARSFRTLCALAGLAALWLLVAAEGQERISYQGENGFKQSFSLSGGQYRLYVYARDPIAENLPAGFDKCVFGGSLERTSPTYESLPLGSSIRVSQSDWTPWKIDREMTLTAGRYTLYVLSTTDCQWTFELDSTAKADDSPVFNVSLTNGCFLRSCVLPPIALAPGSPNDSGRSVSLRAHAVEFVAPFVRRGNSARPSGTYVVKQGGKTLREQPLQVDEDPEGHHDHFYIVETWNKGVKPEAGKITVEFVTNLGRSSAEFTVTGD